MRWLMEAGCWISESTLPRLTAGVMSRTPEITRCGSPYTSKEIIAPPIRG